MYYITYSKEITLGDDPDFSFSCFYLNVFLPAYSRLMDETLETYPDSSGLRNFSYIISLSERIFGCGQITHSYRKEKV